jgi:tetratricopeptide (TPR) repeat protein
MDIEDDLYMKALELRKQGKIEDSFQILLDLNLRSPNEIRVSLLIGTILSEQGRKDEAIVTYQQAIELWPQDSSASLCLFHSLWDSKRYEEAFLEAVRFDQMNNSIEYIEILNNFSKFKFRGYVSKPGVLILVQDQLDRYPISYRPPYDDPEAQNSTKGQ